jgi:hypothetical protein
MASTENKVYILISLEDVSDKINSLIDAGYFEDAKSLDYQIWSLIDKVKSIVIERGGEVLLSTYERQVLLLPISIAENLPFLIDGYKSLFGQKMKVGIGLTLIEAKKASDLSGYTGNIEMYDPEQQEYQEMQKDELTLENDLFNLNLPPNLYDRHQPKSPEPVAEAAKIGKFVAGPDAKQALELESQFIQATVQQINAPAQQSQQQMQQQMQQQAQQFQPNNLMEALSGQQSNPQAQQQLESERSEPKEKMGASAVEEAKQSDKEDEDHAKQANKIANLLEMVNEKIPKLTDLADKNPEAFKKVIGLVHKIVDMAKDKKKEVAKSEVDDLTENLNKAIKLFYPVGTVKKGRKKVIKNGRAVWRSVRSGMVKDNEGNAISVASHNAQADEGNIGAK